MKTRFAHVCVCEWVRERDWEGEKHVNDDVTHYSTNNANYK